MKTKSILCLFERFLTKMHSGMFIAVLTVILSTQNALACNTNYTGFIYFHEDTVGMFRFIVLDKYSGGWYTYNRRFNWDFGDGTTGTGLPVHTYASQGRYNVSVISFDTVANCSDTFYANVCYFHAKPNPTITRSGNTVTISQSCSSNYIYYWDFDDGYSDSGCTPSHTYTGKGLYKPRLYMLTDTLMKCTDSLYEYRNWNWPVINVTRCGFDPDFKFTYIPPQLKYNTAIIESHPFGSYYTRDFPGKDIWDWGNGDTSMRNIISYESNWEHVFSQAGNHTICHILVDSSGTCVDTACHSIWMDSCVLSLDFDYTVLGKAVILTAQTPAPDVYWTFPGAYGQQTYKTTSATFLEYGYHKICIDAREDSCVKRVCKTILLDTCKKGKADFNAFIDTSGCRKLGFVNTSMAGKYYWNFGDWTGSNSASPAHTYQNNGYYFVRLKVVDSLMYWCVDSVTKPVWVHCSPCSFDDSLSLDYDSTKPFEATLNNYFSGPIHRHFWNFGDGNTSTSSSPVHVYAQKGLYTITYIATDTINNCSDTVLINVGIDSSGNISKRWAFTLKVVTHDRQLSLPAYEVSNLLVFPNPFSDKLVLRGAEAAEILEVHIYNTLGQDINLEYRVSGDECQVRLTEGTGPGIYILKIGTATGTSVFRLLKN